MENRNHKTQLAVLFTSHLAILISGMGLFPILPIFAAEFGAGPGLIGLYLAFTYFSITAGTMLIGWLPARINRKTVFMMAGLAGIPALVLMGFVQYFWQLVILTGVIWFTGGVGIVMVQVFTGQLSGKKDRGKSFGIQSLATPLGALLGGAVVAALIDSRGYTSMFLVLALIWAIWPLLAALFLNIPAQVGVDAGKKKDRSVASSTVSSANEHAFGLILMAVLLTAFTISIGRLGLSLSMHELHFSPAQISSTSVISGLFGIPLLLAMSAGAARLSARFFMFFGFFAAVAATLVILSTHEIQYFQAAAVLFLLSQSINRSMSFALVAETFSAGELGKKLPWLGTANWAANIAGFASVGPGLAVLGSQTFYLAIAVLPLLSTLLILIAASSQSFPSLSKLLVWMRLDWVHKPERQALSGDCDN